MSVSEQFKRFPSVPLVDLDLLLSDGVETSGPNLLTMASCQVELHKSM